MPNQYPRLAEMLSITMAASMPSDDQRPGQAAWNRLYQLDPGKARQYQGTKLDPFHNEEALPAFFTDLWRTWA